MSDDDPFGRAERERAISDEPQRYVGQLPSGLWLLVEKWPNALTVATREHPSHTWSPPVELEAQ